MVTLGQKGFHLAKIIAVRRLRRGFALAPDTVPTHLRVMFTVSESVAEAIRRAYEAGGELSAVVELRRHFPGIIDNENARLCVRTIASWTPLPPRTRPRGRQRCPTKS
jgi:alkanesulfonate monooxygenase SsuD/methylene tetrahydromethanopterin reductase-like flavin-dependent oxidoreductase (luciferase family)